MNGVLTGVVVDLRLRAVRLFLGRAAEVRGAVQGQDHPRSVQGRRRHRRRLAGVDHDQQRRARRPRQLADGRQAAAAARGREISGSGFAENLGRDPRAAGARSGAADGVPRAGAGQLLPQERPAEVRHAASRRSATWGSSRAAASRSPTSSACRPGTCRFSSTTSPGTCSRVHRGVDGAVGTAVLRPHLRFGALTQLMDAVCRQVARRASPPWLEQRAASNQVRRCSPACSSTSSSRATSPIYRYVEPFWMFGLFGTTAMWIGLGGAAASRRSSSAISTAGSSARSARARPHVEPDGVPDQALVRVQDLQDLREDLRVGRDPRAEDRRERVRALRRLRAALHGQQKCPHWIIIRAGKVDVARGRELDGASSGGGLPSVGGGDSTSRS